MQRAGGKLLSSRLPAAEAEEAYRRRQWIIYFVYWEDTEAYRLG
jgi:hypothetical protein